MVLRDILGFSIDYEGLDKQLGQMRNAINIATNKMALVDDENDPISEQERLWQSLLTEEH